MGRGRGIPGAGPLRRVELDPDRGGDPQIFPFSLEAIRTLPPVEMGAVTVLVQSPPEVIRRRLSREERADFRAYGARFGASVEEMCTHFIREGDRLEGVLTRWALAPVLRVAGDREPAQVAATLARLLFGSGAPVLPSDEPTQGAGQLPGPEWPETETRMGKKKQPAASDPEKLHRELMAQRFEAFARYKEAGAEARKFQAEIARLDAELVRAGFAVLTNDPVLW